MALLSWPHHFHAEQAHTLHSQRPNSLSPRAFIPSSCLGIEWSNNSSSLCDSPPQARLVCWIFILHAFYSWSFAPRWLEISLKLLLCVVSIGKFVLPIFVIVSISRTSLWQTWVRKELRETRSFMNPSTRMYDPLWIWSSGLNLMSLLCSCTYLFYYYYLPFCWAYLVLDLYYLVYL
jgi:hypothetical protein